jgi:hypothetical protein
MVHLDNRASLIVFHKVLDKRNPVKNVIDQFQDKHEHDKVDNKEATLSISSRILLSLPIKGGENQQNEQARDV